MAIPDNIVTRAYSSNSDIIFLVHNEGRGSPYSIGVLGAVKCLICYESTIDRLVCDFCRRAVMRMRSNEGRMATGFVNVLAENPALLKVIEHLGSEAIARYFIDSINAIVDEH